jgi:hypothetical protein
VKGLLHEVAMRNTKVTKGTKDYKICKLGNSGARQPK